MPDEVIPKTEAASWIDSLSLPKLIAGPAGEALSRLIAGATDIPLAWLERKASEIRARTEGMQAVTNAVATEVAATSRKDAALIERATNSLLIKEFRKQKNKEGIAQKTVEYLEQEPMVGEQPAPPDDDWFNLFEQYAEQASSEKLQNLWARVLAGEIRRPKSFSLRTLRFIAELDQETAMIFESHLGAVIAGSFIIKSTDADSDLREVLVLEEAGLLAGAGGFLSKPIELAPGGAYFSYCKKYIRLDGTQGTKLEIPCYVLTRVGRELAALLEPEYDQSQLNKIIAAIPKPGLARIEIGSIFEVDGKRQFFRENTLWHEA